jgi:hypothetical protein
MEKKDRSAYTSESILGRIYDMVVSPETFQTPSSQSSLMLNLEPDSRLVMLGSKFWSVEVQVAEVFCKAYNCELLRYEMCVCGGGV